MDGLGNPTDEIKSTQFNYDYISLPLKVGKYVGNEIRVVNVRIINIFLLTISTFFTFIGPIENPCILIPISKSLGKGNPLPRKIWQLPLASAGQNLPGMN
jgi:hypothetical protein